MKIRIVHLTLLAAVTACVKPRVVVTPLGPERSYPATPDSVSIPLFATALPACPFDEIAALTAEVTDGLATDAEILGALRTKARAVGGQAIIGFSQGVRGNGGDSPAVRYRAGTAIHYRAPDCMKE